MENTALLSLHSIQNPLKSKAGCSSQDSNRIKFPFAIAIDKSQDSPRTFSERQQQINYNRDIPPFLPSA
jgi:hypothetical protein